MVTYKVKDLLLFQFRIFLNSPDNLILCIFSLDLVYAGDTPGGMWLSPTSHLSTGVVIKPLCMAISLNSFATTVRSKGAVDRVKDSVLNWYVRPWTLNLICPGLFLYRYMEVGIVEIY